MNNPSFIETQFPVSKLSKESYKERKAVSGQTLTALGKWWGRKPLVLVRALILGLLLPTTDDPKRDRDIFLKLMTMDGDGLWQRRAKAFAVTHLYEQATTAERKSLFTPNSTTQQARFKRNLSSEQSADREHLERRVFEALSYDEKLEYCDRPEQIDGPSPEAWVEINTHLGTRANNLQELARELGERRFGHLPRIGDAFCGGGSVPFEAARLGCQAYGSDLNPVAAFLTWGALNIVGGGEQVAKQVAESQRAVYEAVDRQITEWGIEHNEQGWRADAYLYCTEVVCPECQWRVPLAPSWVIAEKGNVIARLIANGLHKCYDFEVVADASTKEFAAAQGGTVRDSELVCPHCKQTTSMASLRGDGKDTNGFGNSLRLWTKDDFAPRDGDVFGERLYCIRWIEKQIADDGAEETVRHYCAPTPIDLKRETQVRNLLNERYIHWQKSGYIPDLPIEPGGKTTEPIRTRGWTYWHHLFTPRQLLINGLFAAQLAEATFFIETGVRLLLLGRIANLNSRLCRWLASQSGGSGGGKETFDNQALNTLCNYSNRAWGTLNSCAIHYVVNYIQIHSATASVKDARAVSEVNDCWITDPPYADAINYHELSEFFLSWYGKHLTMLFPEWYTDSKRALAIQGADDGFRYAMVECYKNLTAHMPNDGLQVVMFTHQDAGVWADLALILWAAGLCVTAAWTIATETESAMKKGNYVQGTVLLVLRKRAAEQSGFLDEIMADIQPEVEKQLAAMQDLDDAEDPNFGDSDYQLAAYAAALRVLTQYAHIEEIDIDKELARSRQKEEKSPIEGVIENAVKIASNYLIPKALHNEANTRSDAWRNLSAEERFYIKGLEVESHGEGRQGVYQEFARGFGVKDYTAMLASGTANEARLKTASEFKNRELGSAGFGSSLLRQCLFAIYTVRDSEKPAAGLRWLKDEAPGDYWSQRNMILVLLRYIERLPMPHWREDAAAAALLAGIVENDTV